MAKRQSSRKSRSDLDEVGRLRAAMKAVRLPKVVKTWIYRFGQDSTDVPAVWIWLILDDDAPDADAFAPIMMRLSREIHRALQDAGLDHWPYLHVRTVSEQKEL